MHSATCIHEKIFIIILQNVKCIHSVYENRNIQYVCFCLEKVMLMICWLIFSSVPHCLPDVDVWHVERSHLTELYAGATAEPHFPSFSQYFPILVSLYIYVNVYDVQHMVMGENDEWNLRLGSNVLMLQWRKMMESKQIVYLTAEYVILANIL